VRLKACFGKLREKVTKMDEYPLTALVTLALVSLGWVLSFRVAKARENFAAALEDPEKFHSLQIYSDPDFMVVFRNHQNLLEHLIVVLPALWIFALSISDGIAFILGFTYFIGRIWWARNYPRNYSHRPAFFLCFFSLLALLVGAAGSTIYRLISG
tara:strand:- start:180 stop:647 length:468 start_codon:yes stop_codon:yes gene_type:complete